MEISGHCRNTASEQNGGINQWDLTCRGSECSHGEEPVQRRSGLKGYCMIVNSSSNLGLYFCGSPRYTPVG